jgi:hypothetical protein
MGRLGHIPVTGLLRTWPESLTKYIAVSHRFTVIGVWLINVATFSLSIFKTRE